MSMRLPWGTLTVWLASCVGATAAPILNVFEGTIVDIEDAGGWAEAFELADGGSVEAVFLLDREAGVIQFGDGEYGARLPSGSNVSGGSYRAGGGKEGNLLILDDCWVDELDCVPNQGGDAYIVELFGRSDAGVDHELVIELSSTDDTILDGGADIDPLPPDPRLFENARFRWMLTDGARTSTLEGNVDRLRALPEPPTFALLVLGLAAACRKRDA